MSLASFAAKFMAGASRAERRKVRRGLIARSFTRFLARRPIGAAAVGERGAAWRKEMAGWSERWAAARANGTTVRRGAR